MTDVNRESVVVPGQDIRFIGTEGPDAGAGVGGGAGAGAGAGPAAGTKRGASDSGQQTMVPLRRETDGRFAPYPDGLFKWLANTPVGAYVNGENPELAPQDVDSQGIHYYNNLELSLWGTS